MPRFIVDVIPHMEDQRFFGGRLARWAIDPTCGRYALKSLLKYFYEKRDGVRVTNVNVGHKYADDTPEYGKSSSLLEFICEVGAYALSNRVGYDPYDNFPRAEELLEKGRRPDSALGWCFLLQCCGPIIVSGQPLGAAAAVGHVILVVGIDTDKQNFYYLDSLVGEDVQTAPFLPMNNNICTEIVRAKANICALLRGGPNG